MAATRNSMTREFQTKSPTDNILVGADFNCVPDQWLDRLPTKYVEHKYNQNIKTFCTNNSLIDVWKYNNPNFRPFAWIRPNGSCKSRTDLWLTTQDILKFVCQTEICAAPTTDHCGITVTLMPETGRTFRQKHWKFNDDF